MVSYSSDRLPRIPTLSKVIRRYRLCPVLFVVFTPRVRHSSFGPSGSIPRDLCIARWIDPGLVSTGVCFPIPSWRCKPGTLLGSTPVLNPSTTVSRLISVSYRWKPPTGSFSSFEFPTSTLFYWDYFVEREGVRSYIDWMFTGSVPGVGEEGIICLSSQTFMSYVYPGRPGRLETLLESPLNESFFFWVEEVKDVEVTFEIYVEVFPPRHRRILHHLY